MNDAATSLTLVRRLKASPERVSRVTLILRTVAEGTELTLTHDRLADVDTVRSHERGWSASLDRLEVLAPSL